jgi:hypothetical protein
MRPEDLIQPVNSICSQSESWTLLVAYAGLNTEWSYVFLTEVLQIVQGLQMNEDLWNTVHL